MSGLLEQLARLLEGSGLDLVAIGLGWARAAPVVTIVPAFGLRAIPSAARATLGLALAVTIAPAMVGQNPVDGAQWGVALALSFLQGLPIAVAAAVPLWAATMTGGVIDALRGAGDEASAPTVEGRASPLGVLFSLLASAIFLATGGPARVALVLVTPPQHLAISSASVLLRVAADITNGVQIAMAVGAPVLVASVVIELSGALIARSASPAQVHTLLAPVRSLGVLAITALLLDRMLGLLAVAVRNAP